MAEIKYIDPAEFIREGFLQEANRCFFHPLGLALQADPGSGELKVWDYREDPEGMEYAEGVIDRGKVDRVLAEYRRHASTRKGKWNGSAIQGFAHA